jgi:hypothetical protein
MGKQRLCPFAPLRSKAARLPFSQSRLTTRSFSHSSLEQSAPQGKRCGRFLPRKPASYQGAIYSSPEAS